MSGAVGFYGKLPGAGDFVGRRLPSGFVDIWDRHFQHAIEAGRAELSAQWTAVYRDGPAWRFILPAQVCGESVWCGLVGPAEDRVGRGFPMVLAVPCDGALAAGMLANGEWFDALERVFVSAQYEALGVDAFDARVAALPQPPAHAYDAQPWWRDLDWDSGQWRLTSTQEAAAALLLEQAWQQLAARPGAWCLWWTRRAERLLATRGLPASYAMLLEARGAQDFASLLEARDAQDSTLLREPRGTRDHASQPEPWLADLSAAAFPHTGTGAGLDEGHAQVERPSAHDARAVSATSAQPSSLPHAGAQRTFASGGSFDTQASAVPECFASLAAAALLSLDRGRTLLVAADDGLPDPRRRAAQRMRAAALASAHDLTSLQATLLALHAPLRASADDPLQPVHEDGVALAARFEAGRVQLLRIGAAAAWHWRRGVLTPLFVERAAGVGGEFDDLLFGEAWRAPSGLGSAAGADCDEAGAAFEPGDRLLLLATRHLTQLPHEVFAEALGLPSCEDARTYIAACAGLHATSATSAHWPLAVIEEGA